MKLLGCSEVCALHMRTWSCVCACVRACGPVYCACTWAYVSLDTWSYVCMRVVLGCVGLCVCEVCSCGRMCGWHVGLCVVSHGRQVGA